ncbi:MAG TPA: hypothetical protein VE621_07010, partial [Bryobacteraceae bacterium]|nr:hypothetical protein [Bryobacteraceae bacterium]
GLAGKPLWIGVSARDFFGTYSPMYIEDGRKEFAKLQGVYRVLGAERMVEWYETPLPHALSHDLRVQIYNFLERHLRGSEKTVAEPPVKPEPDATLCVGKTGNVVRDFGSKTPLKLAQEKIAEPQPSAVVLPRVLQMDMRKHLQADKHVEWRTLGKAIGESGGIEAMEVDSDEQVWLPGFVFLPRVESKTVLLALDPRGRAARWREGDLYHQLASTGLVVAAFDVRGVGDLSPEVSSGNPFYTKPHAEEDSYAWASLILGRSLLGQRVTDILAIGLALRKRFPGSRLVVAANGHLSTSALFAGSLDPEIAKVLTAGGLRSYKELLESEEYSEPFANFIPNGAKLNLMEKTRAGLGSRFIEAKAWTVEALSSL